MADPNLPEIRTIHVNGSLGRRQFREMLSSLLASLIVTPGSIWLVSPWVSDFDVLDNRSGEWDRINPSWGHRVVRFSELLVNCVESGCDLTLVCRDLNINKAFLSRVQGPLGNSKQFRSAFSNDLHAKGLLTRSWYLSGSMNFTYSGANKNDEQIQLIVSSDLISETKLEFERFYNPLLP